MNSLIRVSRILLLLSLCSITILNSSPAYAARNDELRSIYGDSSFYDTSGEACGVPGSNQLTSTGTNVFILGDSITNQSRTDLAAAAQAAGYTITGIDADPGRAISSDTAPPGNSALDAVAAYKVPNPGNADTNALKDADSVIVALGTNSGTEDLNAQIPALTLALREVKPGIQIFWVNLFYTAAGGPASRNLSITDNSAAEKSDYKIIDTLNAGIQLGTDGIHPTPAGNATFAQTIFSGLKAFSTVGSTIEGGTRTLTYPNFQNEEAAAKAIDDYILANYPASPFNGLGKHFISGGKRSNVNPFLAAGHLQMENGFATANGGWHSLTPPTYNAFGATGSAPTVDYFSKKSGITYKVIVWPSWKASLDSTLENSREDWFEAIRRKYLNPGSTYESHTFEEYLSHYAPGSAGNDEGVYLGTLYAVIDKLSAGIGITNGPAQGCGDKPTAGTGTYSFPLAPQTKSVGGIRVGQTTATHHDGTPAFDLFSTLTRAKVYAIYDGTPVTINQNFNGVAGCSSIQFQADDGFYYWYGHLEEVTVQEGVHIASGTPMASIADKPTYNSRCWGGAPHLHIDRGCTIAGTPQRGGSDACRDPEFIPFLAKIYEGLQ